MGQFQFLKLHISSFISILYSNTLFPQQLGTRCLSSRIRNFLYLNRHIIPFFHDNNISSLFSGLLGFGLYYIGLSSEVFVCACLCFEGEGAQ